MTRKEIEEVLRNTVAVFLTFSSIVAIRIAFFHAGSWTKWIVPAIVVTIAAAFFQTLRTIRSRRDRTTTSR